MLMMLKALWLIMAGAGTLCALDAERNGDAEAFSLGMFVAGCAAGGLMAAKHFGPWGYLISMMVLTGGIWVSDHHGE